MTMSVWFGLMCSGHMMPQECVGKVCFWGFLEQLWDLMLGFWIGVPVTMGGCATRDPVATK